MVTLDDGRSAFVKAAADHLTASSLRDEHLNYALFRGAPFLPGYLGWHDDGELPVLVIEDLSRAAWPPPWTRTQVDAVLAALDELHARPAPVGLPRAADERLGLRDGWREVAEAHEAFLALGLCSPVWLEAYLETLLGAVREVELDGDAPLHFDVRSDNVCFRDGRAILVDWNWASVGNPQIDAAFWLPSLHAEGGPVPEEVLPNVDAGLAACCAGFFCAHAARPPIPAAPGVRAVQLAQARVALPWAARALDLEPPL